MRAFVEGDPIRILTMLACAGLIGLAVEGLYHRRGYPAPHVFILSWSAHVLLFYVIYYLTDRWAVSEEVRAVVGYWPPVIWAQGALSVLILEVARRLWGVGRNG